METLRGIWLEPNLFESEYGIKHIVIPITYLPIEKSDMPFSCFINCEKKHNGLIGMGDTMIVYSYTKEIDLMT